MVHRIPGPLKLIYVVVPRAIHYVLRWCLIVYPTPVACLVNFQEQRTNKRSGKPRATDKHSRALLLFHPPEKGLSL